jgi:ADP-ribose pyrophosphatase YjhB (NUDIX family)
MLIRNCSGGVVFWEDNVLILKNEKGEWSFPKGVIKNERTPNEVATARVRYESGVKAEIVSPVGETSYEFYSTTRRKPVCNRINWFVMEAEKPEVSINKMEGFTDGGFYNFNDALEMITYSQDQSLLKYAYNKYKESSERKAELV